MTDDVTSHADDARLAELATPAVVKVASATTALTGLFVALTAIQILDVRWQFELLDYVPYLMLLLGGSAVGLAIKLYRMRAWAATAASGVSGSLALLMGGWLLFAIAN